MSKTEPSARIIGTFNQVPKYDWEKIKTEYVESVTAVTLEVLSAKYNCSLSSMRKRSAAENWQQKRNLYIQKVELKRQDKKSTILATEQATWDNDCFEAAGLALSQIMAHLNRELEISDIDPLTRSLERVQKIGRTSLGEADAESKVSVDLRAIADYSSMTTEELAQEYQERLKQA